MANARWKPSYRWVCHVCNSSNAAGQANCAHCGFKAFASGKEIAAVRPAQNPDAEKVWEDFAAGLWWWISLW